MTQRRLVLFDIDGTILHGGKLFRECLEASFAACLPGKTAERIPFSGKTDRQICREMLAGLVDAHEIDPLVERILGGYLSRVREGVAAGRAGEVRLLPGVREAVSALATHSDVKLGLLTGNVREGARLKLGTVEMLPYFESGRGAFGDDHWDRYELPRIAVARAYDELGIRYEGKQVVIIGDTVHDVNCGKSIGVRSIGVATGRADNRAEILAASPDHFFENLADTASVLSAILS